MKVLLINGSPHENGNTAIALKEMQQIFDKEGVETHFLHIGSQAVCGCVACGFCASHGRWSQEACFQGGSVRRGTIVAGQVVTRRPAPHLFNIFR